MSDIVRFFVNLGTYFVWLLVAALFTYASGKFQTFDYDLYMQIIACVALGLACTKKDR